MGLDADGILQTVGDGNQFIPAVIHITHHLVAVSVKNSSDIILEVLDVVIGCSIVQESNEAFGVIVNENPSGYCFTDLKKSWSYAL